MIDNHELQPHMDSVDARLYFCSCKFFFTKHIGSDRITATF